MLKKKKLAVLDTCVIIDALAADDASPTDSWQRDQALEVLSELQKTHRIAVSAVTIAELGRGAPEPTFRALLDSIPELLVLALDESSALTAGPLRFAARPTSKDERRFQDLDALIVGTAVGHGANVLVTSNISDFQKLVAGTSVELRNHLGQPTKRGSQLKLVPNTGEPGIAQMDPTGSQIEG